MRLSDGRVSFGWPSIGLHWVGAGIVITLLFVGNSIRASTGVSNDDMLRLHTTIALAAYGLLWLRIGWRLRNGHPGPLPRQKRVYHAIGKVFHYILLTGLAAMLFSGPLLAWSGGLPLRLGSLTVPSPISPDFRLHEVVLAVHIAGATILGWGTLIHIVAVAKHLIIDKDGAFDKMMMPLPEPNRDDPD